MLRLLMVLLTGCGGLPPVGEFCAPEPVEDTGGGIDHDLDDDGLRNAWDGDPLAADIARGPTGGLECDEPWIVSGEETVPRPTQLVGGAAAGDTELVLADVGGLVPGTEVLVLSHQGSDAGVYEFVFVAEVGTDTVSVEPPLRHDYADDSVVTVQEVIHTRALIVTRGGVLRPEPWDGAGGGVLVIRALEHISVRGLIDASGRGYRGGAAALDGVDGYQGESYTGPGGLSVHPNAGGGGGANIGVCQSPIAGGGGHEDPGEDGDPQSNAEQAIGGEPYGEATLETWFMGSGGGGGGLDEGCGAPGDVAGKGGGGGGIITLWSEGPVTVEGTVRAKGFPGGDAVSDGGFVGAGGGGAGGQIWLVGSEILWAGSISTRSGLGGVVANPTGVVHPAGRGGSGWTRLDADTIDATEDDLTRVELTGPYTGVFSDEPSFRCQEFDTADPVDPVDDPCTPPQNVIAGGAVGCAAGPGPLGSAVVLASVLGLVRRRRP